ncbi:MAG: peptidylprolyl isomerase [Cyclobacteriaceae bacterium]|nr:peptidylprolyl isomerase [Cyclobacteriaceae bacterium]
MKVRITTSKGEIVLRMLINEAPGAVANFLQLIEKGYYNGLTFHRVVPDFVVQGGCHRGDGWGGEDYSIRSELGPQRYQEGSVGMASAGKDTEGTQWFITHSPTPHLDGRYTIFAQVTEGMEVIHTLEIGDRIIDVQRVIVNE